MQIRICIINKYDFVFIAVFPLSTYLVLECYFNTAHTQNEQLHVIIKQAKKKKKKLATNQIVTADKIRQRNQYKSLSQRSKH